MSDAQKGLAGLIAANVIWGLSPIYYKELAHVPPMELLSHRTLWSLVFFGAILAAQGRLRAVAQAAQGPGAGLKLVLGAALISVNWGLFIWAIQVARTVEVSLGYYMFPLISVVLGMVIFREGWQPGKVLGFVLAMAAAAVLTYGLGAAPWVSLALAVSFAGYSVIKKSTATGPTVSVTAEVLILSPLALGWLLYLYGSGASMGAADWGDAALLLGSGPLTAAPLVLFSYASRRLRMATLGLVQYLNPTLQFLVAVLIFTEPFTLWHAIALPLIWLGVAVYSVEALARDRAARRATTSASTS